MKKISIFFIGLIVLMFVTPLYAATFTNMHEGDIVVWYQEIAPKGNKAYQTQRYIIADEAVDEDPAYGINAPYYIQVSTTDDTTSPVGIKTVAIHIAMFHEGDSYTVTSSDLKDFPAPVHLFRYRWTSTGLANVNLDAAFSKYDNILNIWGGYYIPTAPISDLTMPAPMGTTISNFYPMKGINQSVSDYLGNWLNPAFWNGRCFNCSTSLWWSITYGIYVKNPWPGGALSTGCKLANDCVSPSQVSHYLYGYGWTSFVDSQVVYP